MFCKLASQSATPLLRRLVVGVCLAAYLALVIGFPVPAVGPIEVGLEKFPCQAHGCGCQTADHCWRACCCMTMQEKLHWAEQHGVTPPDDLVSATADSEPQGSACSCCKKSTRSEGSAIEPVQETSTSKYPAATPRVDSRRQVAYEWIVGVRARQCQGVSTNWLTSGAVMPLPPPFDVTGDDGLLTYSCPAIPGSWQNVASPPDAPPPWI